MGGSAQTKEKPKRWLYIFLWISTCFVNKLYIIFISMFINYIFLFKYISVGRKNEHFGLLFLYSILCHPIKIHAISLLDQNFKQNWADPPKISPVLIGLIIIELFTYGPLFGATFFSLKFLCLLLKKIQKFSIFCAPSLSNSPSLK